MTQIDKSHTFRFQLSIIITHINCSKRKQSTKNRQLIQEKIHLQIKIKTNNNNEKRLDPSLEPYTQ